MKFEDKVSMGFRCSVPYINACKVRRAGVPAQMTLGQVLDLGRAIEYGEHDAQGSCLRNGLMLSTDWTVGGMRDNHFVIGNAELIGVGDIVKCKCDKTYDVMADSVKGRSRFCFEKLSTGKCEDPFVRETVGRVLFPQYYAKQK